MHATDLKSPPPSSAKVLAGGLFLSWVLHLIALAVLIGSQTVEDKPPAEPIKVTIRKIPPKPQAPPQPPKVKPRTVRKAKPKGRRKPKAVMGLGRKSFTPDTRATMAAPAGNTTMEKDRGLRLRPEDVEALGQDLSAGAKLIGSSIPKIDKTSQALDAGLTGRWTVDVYVDEKGRVRRSEMSRKIGYGMDPLVRSAADNARFHPRRNAKGDPVPGWTRIIFRFTED